MGTGNVRQMLVNETWKMVSNITASRAVNLHTKTPWPQSASELYRPSDRRLSANLLPTLLKQVSHGQRNGSLRPYFLFSRPEPLLFLPSSSSFVLMRLSGPRSRLTSSQKIWYRGNRTRTYGSVARNSDH
jgi:hypothetical protein